MMRKIAREDANHHRHEDFKTSQETYCPLHAPDELTRAIQSLIKRLREVGPLTQSK